MGSISEIPLLQMERSMGRAAILGLGTANPPNPIDQSTFPDYYFKLTGNEHMVDLKSKLTRICKSSMINTRYSYVTMPDIIQQNPSLCSYDANTLDFRQELMDVQMPKLGAEAATEAISDWGRPKSEITHLIFCNSGGASMPGADYDVINLLGLPLSTRRFMLHQQGCFGGGSVLRLAKDLAENNRGARVLVICCEIVTIAFRGPSEDHVENLVAQALFGDGASAAIVGADPLPIERTIFEIVRTAQNILPGSDGCIVGKLREAGLMVTLMPGVPLFIAGNAKKLVADALRPVGITELNDVFWVVHPGGRAILDAVQQTLKLREEKFAATREVLREYGNMSSASVMFVMDLMRKRSKEKGLGTAGEGLEWGILFGFGPGITAETVLLRCPQ